MSHAEVLQGFRGGTGHRFIQWQKRTRFILAKEVEYWLLPFGQGLEGSEAGSAPSCCGNATMPRILW